MKKQKDKTTHLADRKGQRPALPFDRDKVNTTLKRVRQKHSFEDTKRKKDKNDDLAEIWDEDLCE